MPIEGAVTSNSYNGVGVNGENIDVSAILPDSDRLERKSKSSKISMDSVSLQDKCIKMMKNGEWAHLEIWLRHLTKAEFDLNAVDEETGLTPLIFSVKECRLLIAERLIELGANVNHTIKDGFTALHFAVQTGKEEIVRAILRRNGDATLVTSKSQLPLHLACGKANTPLIIIQMVLRSSGKDARLFKDINGLTPLHYATINGNYHTCKELLSSHVVEQLTSITNVKKETVLHLACRNKELEIIKLLIEYGAEVDATNADGQTPLHISSWEGDEATVKYFYQAKADANIVDNLDRTPLHVAAERGQNRVIEVLIDKFKCNYSLRTKDGSTLMHIASECGHQSTALLFLRKGVPLHMPNKAGAICLHSACKKGHVSVVRALLQKGAQIDARTKDNYTPLHVAVENCKYLVVQMLLGYGADVQIRGGKAKETPLHIAAKIPDAEKCAEMLLKSGADPNITEENGETALHIACRYGHIKLVRILLNDGSSPFFQSTNGETPLHIAVRYGYYLISKEILLFLQKQKTRLDSVILVNTANQEGETAMHYAAQIKHNMTHNEFDDIDIINLLLDYGGDINSHAKLTQETAMHYCASSGNINILWEIAKRIGPEKLQIAINKQSKNGWSPLLVAAEKGHTEIVRLLLFYNARSDIFEENGKSALHLASESGHCDVVDLLLDRKAFINAKTKNGYTSLHLGCQNGHTELVKLLIERGSDIDALTLTKKTPLHLAAQYGQLEVCNILLKLRTKNSSIIIDATDVKGQSPIHLAAENDHAQIVKLFLKHQPALAKMASFYNGNTCAHIAASKGSVEVLKELMKFNKNIVINARNKTNESTCIHLASSGGHTEVLKVLLEAGANPNEENKEGMTSIHLAAKNGHIDILKVLKDYMSLNHCSLKTGLTALHISSYYGQTDFSREIFAFVAANVTTEKPDGNQKLGDIRLESGLTPLHLAAASGHEGLIRLLLNSPNVVVDASSHKTESIPLHFAAESGHIPAVGLLLSKYTTQLHKKNKTGRTALHLASANGHYDMVSVLIGQGANINLTDKSGWTALHYASLRGHLNVVKLLAESGAPTTFETNEGKIPLCYAASNRHLEVLDFLLTRKHDSYSLLDDNKFLIDLIESGKLNNNMSLEKFILVSEAPVDIAAKLSLNYRLLSQKEKEISQELLMASSFCERIAAELVSMVASLKNVESLLKSVERSGVQFVDVLLNCEQKEVIAHFAVQQYFTDVWDNNLKMSTIKMLITFFLMLLIPVVWVVLQSPFPIRFKKDGVIVNRVPIIKFMCYLISHIYLILLLYLTSIQPLVPINQMMSSWPYYHEWLLLGWFSGLLVAELENPSDKGGLGILKLLVIGGGTIGCMFHVVTFGIDTSNNIRYEILYARNVLFAITLLVSSVQILDFLTFHHLFGPWAIIIRDLMIDLVRFLVILSIFLFGFSCMVTAVYQDVYPDPNNTAAPSGQEPNNALKNPLVSLEFLFFALFGLVDPGDLPTLSVTPIIGLYIQKAVFGSFLVIAVIVLVNLLIAMMSNTYQRIQAQSDKEWKYGRAKLIRNMTKTSINTPAPLNIITKLMRVIYALFKFKFNIFSFDFISFVDETQTQEDVDTILNSNNNQADNADYALSKQRKSIVEQRGDLFETRNHIGTIVDWKRIVKSYMKSKGFETEKSDDDDEGTNMDYE